jgi:CIC family chloride channel protein
MMKEPAPTLSDSFRRLPDQTRTIVVTAFLSLASAGLAVAFLTLTNGLFRITYLWFATKPLGFFLVASLLTITLTSLASGLLLGKLSPEAAGSGIPQLKAAYWKEVGYVPIKPVLVKFVAGVLSIGGGTSLGREGPTVYMSGGLASWLSGFTGSAKRERRNPSLIGASAGLAAAFNTPLAAIVFVLEEIVGDLSSRSIGRVLLSSVIGAFTVYAVIGKQPAFQVPNLEATTWVHYAIAPLVALVAAFLGIIFQRSALALRKKAKGQKKIQPWLLPLCGGLVTWAIGASVFAATGRLGVFSLGYQDLSAVLRNDCIWWVAGILVVAKLVATVASYGFGGCGGIFSPLLFIGGFAGYFIGNLFSLWIPLTPSDLIVLSAVGMSTCLGTVLKAPFSAMLIVFEMTHQFELVPALLIGMFVTMAISRVAGPMNFYDAILVQDGNELHKIRPPLDISGWRDLPVSAIANRKPVMVYAEGGESPDRILDKHPYACFPYVRKGKLVGVLTREDLERAAAEGRPPVPQAAVTALPTEPLHVAAQRFLDSPLGFLVVVRKKGSSEVEAILTLHDLLRAQAAVTD